ncbi:hypothetical protein J3L18_31135 [Mucilaginibacter gossypii]|nr:MULTISPECIES: hypothetical protein [Mucilaginibacter]WMH62877.1 hypothetical protein J3L18_31135 [Mucilaginibacter gossypii]
MPEKNGILFTLHHLGNSERVWGCATEWGVVAPVWYKLPAITQQ